MSKLSINQVGSRSSHKIIKSKESLTSKKSRCSGSLVSEHGSKFGRSVSRFPKCNDPGLVQTLSTDNSRVIRTIFNPTLQVNSQLPDLTQLQATDCIRELGKSLNILDYEFNYTSFWLLDILSKLVKDIQMENFSPSDQNIFLSWFRFVLRCISVGGGSREETFILLQEMFKSAVMAIEEGQPIPQPEEVEIQDTLDPVLPADLKSVLSAASPSRSATSRNSRKLSLKVSRSSSLKSSKKSLNTSAKRSKSLSRNSSASISEPHNSVDEIIKLNLKVFYTIVEKIYYVFADRFVYTMISLAYSSPVMLTPVDVHLEFHDPKPLKPEPVLPPVVIESPKSRKSKTKGKSKKSIGSKRSKGSKKSSRTSKMSAESGAGDEKSKRDKKGRKGKKAEAPAKEDKDVKGSSKSKGRKKSPRKSKLSSESEVGGKKEKKTKKDKKEGKGGKKAEAPAKEDKDVEGSSKSKGRKKSPRTSKISAESGADDRKDKKSKKDKKGSKGGSKMEAPAEEEKDVGAEKNKGKGKERESKTPKSEKGKGKKKGKSSKGDKDKSDVNKVELVIDEREIALRLLSRQFDRVISPEMKEEENKKNLYLMPLSDAVNKSFVMNILQTVMPQEVIKEKEPKETKEKSRKSKQSTASSTKGKKRKSKGKKK